MKRKTQTWAVAAALVLAGLAGGGWWLWNAQIDRLQAETSTVLKSVAVVRSGELASWRAGAIARASDLVRNPILTRVVADWRRSPASEIRPLFDLLQQQGPYSDVQLVSAGGRIEVSHSGRTGSIDSPEQQALSAAFRTGRPVLSPLSVTRGGLLRLSVIAPLAPTKGLQAGTQTALLIELAAQQSLHPILAVPRHNSGFETWVVSRESGTPIAVRDARSRQESSGLLHLAAGPGELASVASALDRRDVLDATDHQGVRRLAAFAPVEGSDWAVVTTLERERGLAGWRAYALLLVGLLAALLAASTLAFLLAWQRRARVDAEAMLASESRHRTILQTALDGFVLMDREANILDVNESFCRLVGYGREEVVGKSIRNFDMTPDDQFVEKQLKRILAQGHDRFEARHRRKDGRLIDLDVNVQLLPDGGGRLVGFHRDITARKHAEESVRISEERLTQALHVANIGVFDHDHLDPSRYFARNLQMFHNAGSDEPTTLDLTLSRVHPDDLKLVEDAVLKSNDPSGDGLFEVEHRLLLPDGAVRWVRTRAQTFFALEGGLRRPVRTVGATIETTLFRLAETERERLRNELHQAQKLESLGRLAGGVAHEFNNLLTIINGSAEILLTRLPRQELPHKLADAILTAGNRAAGLSSQLLAVGRKQLIRRTVVEINEIVLEVESLLRERIGEGIRLVTTLTHHLDFLEADHDQIFQIIMNLVLNARDAMCGEGTIEIATANEAVPAPASPDAPRRQPGRYVVLSVSDTGAGMPPEVLDRIFEPFFTTKPQGKGTGLGLASVLGIVEQNHGWIDVQSQLGRGTSFRVFLPSLERVHGTARPDPERQPQPEVAVPPSVEGTILVVEDQLALLDLAMSMLRMNGYTVLGATSGQEALAAAAAYPEEIHLLLSDLMMPGMQGDELARRLLQVRPDIRVLFMTGHATERLSGRELLEHGGDYIQKPFREKDLTSKVQQVLCRQPAA